MRYFILFGGIVSLALTGCASLDRSECELGDWGGIGYTDGAKGATVNALERHGKACARYQIAPNIDVWRTGYEAGLDTYCTEASGLARGIKGESYAGVCIRPGHERFVPAYNDARHVFELEKRVEYALSAIDDSDRKIDDLREELYDIDDRIANDPHITAAETREARDRQEEIRHELHDEKNDRRRHQSSLRYAEIQASEAREWLITRYGYYPGY